MKQPPRRPWRLMIYRLWPAWSNSEWWRRRASSQFDPDLSRAYTGVSGWIAHLGVKTMDQAVILSAVRTPIGKFMGGLAPLTAPELGAKAIAEAVRRAGIGPNLGGAGSLAKRKWRLRAGWSPCRTARIC